MHKEENLQIFTLNGNEWLIAEPEDKRTLSHEIDKKYRLKDTYTKEFWLSILTSTSFREFIEGKYRMAGGEMLGRSFDEVDLAEEFDNASEV